MRVVFVLLAVVALSLAQTVTLESVRAACSQTYFEGMTAQIASSLGPAAIPFLQQLLRDETFTRHDNVVAFLAYLGNAATVQNLVTYGTRSAGASATAPEQQRAALLVPHALGRLAARGVKGATAALSRFALGTAGGFLLSETASEAIFALAYASAYTEIFNAVSAAQSSPSSPVSSAVVSAFTAVLQDPVPAAVLQAYPILAQFNVQAAAPKASNDVSETTNPGADVQGILALIRGVSNNGVAATARPVSPLTTHQINFCNHRSVSSPLSAAGVTSILSTATSYVRSGQFGGDFACGAVLSLTGSASSFGSAGDGLVSINTQTALTSVLGNQCGRVKVVNAINYCGSSGTNIVGCAWTGGWGIAVVRLSNANSEAILWAHEFGHNLGLRHHPSNNNIMFASLNTGGGLDSTQCQSFNPGGANNGGNTPPPPPPPCFALDATVEVQGKGSVRIDSLEEGDMVADGESFSPFITYLHHDSNSSAPFVVISTEGVSRPLVLTVEHYLFIVNGQGSSVTVRADQIKVGDTVEIGSSRTAKVVKVEYRRQAGFTAPMTESGKMLVDGIVASCYSDQETSHETGVTVMKPLVWLSKMFPSLARNDVSHNDIHWYAKVLIQLARMRDNVNEKLDEFRALFPHH